MEIVFLFPGCRTGWLLPKRLPVALENGLLLLKRETFSVYPDGMFPLHLSKMSRRLERIKKKRPEKYAWI